MLLNYFVLQTVPFIFVLMTRRTEEAYKHVFEYIEREVCTLNGVSFMTDFEIPMRNALKAVHPLVELKSCWFHFCQCARRRVSKIPNLAKLIRTNDHARELYKKFLALALLPHYEIIPAFNKIKAEALSIFSKQFHPFLGYFEKQWILKVFLQFKGKIYFIFLTIALLFIYPFK